MHDGLADGDGSLGGGGKACLPLPLPLDRSLIANPNMFAITLAGALSMSPSSLCVRPPSPNPIRHIFRILFMDYYWEGLFVEFFLHWYATVLTHWLKLAYII